MNVKKINEILKQLEVGKEALQCNMENYYRTNIDVLAKIQNVEYLLFEELKIINSGIDPE